MPITESAQSTGQKITPFLWFDDQAEAAANLYVSIFKDSRILSASRYGDGGPGPKGSVMTVRFQLEGQDFMALNGGPHSSSPKPYRSWWTVRPRKRWTSCGKDSLKAATKASAAGLKTNMVCPGKSFPQPWARC